MRSSLGMSPSKIASSIVFGGTEYLYIPYEARGFGVRNDGTITRPSLKIINIGGFLSNYIKNKDDLIGATVTRTRTFLKFLDAVNFHEYNDNLDFWRNKGVNPDPNSKLMDETWIINRKVSENKIAIEYELTSPLDIENAYVPRRQIINKC